MKKFLVVLTGPTCVGKTDSCIRLAQHFQTEILSCDSRQMYQQMNIGTAKPTAEELQLATHHFIDNLNIATSYNAGQYEKDALALIAQLHQKHQIVLMTGGSGLYIDAVCNGFDDLPKASPELRKELEELQKAGGTPALQDKLKNIDSDYFAQLSKDENANPQRLIRALEIKITSGKSIAEFQQNKKQERPFKIIKIVLNRDRAELYERINQRVDIMLKMGLVEEVKQLLPYAHLNAMQTVGYKEIVAYLNNEYDLNEAIRLIKRNTRRYAKRQLTWFRRDPNYHWFHPNDWEKIIQLIEKKLKED